MRTIEIDRLVLEPEEGLLLGNGDLSVSIYQKPGQLVWRFGKNDVWDRRLDTSDDPEPAHIDELVRGIRDEGWVSKRYTADDRAAGRATKGEPADPQRMKELTQGPPAYASRPYPCPKPVGELTVPLPKDQIDQKLSQKVLVEKGEAEIVLTWESGLTYRFTCFVPPHTNALVVRWQVENLTDAARSFARAPVRFVLYRRADPDVEAFACEHQIRTGYWMWEGSIRSPKVTPLPPPAVRKIDGRTAIEQVFHPDVEYLDGFRYALVPFVTELEIEPQEPFSKGDAVVHVRRKQDVPEGWLAIVVPTSTDDGGLEAELGRVAGALADDPAGTMAQWQRDTREAAEAFWSRSAVEIDDPVLEKLWVGTLHARRCAYGPDAVAPGLAFPSTVHDYSLWHGDYHTNYNYQQPFWGNLASNHVELADSFFVGMKHMVEAGREFARKYWNSRGTYIHLVGYPFPYYADPYGTGGICRMSYMTGWVASYWWWRYLYTQDEEWLRAEAYPVIRDAALFYTDTLEKYDDGLYHVFPSPQGESHFTGKVEDYTDRPQVIRHAAYCLRYAIRAAEILDADADLRAQWAEIVEHLAPPAGVDLSGLSEAELRRHAMNFPEFCRPDGVGLPEDVRRLMQTGEVTGHWAGGTGGIPRPWTACIREGLVDPDAAIGGIREVVRREMQVNGVCRGMGTDDMGRVGLYVEGTGMLMPLVEMMLQSWDGCIRVFPAWPKGVDAAFRTLRAEGAFLVSAAQKNGRLPSVTIESEAGGRCRVARPWPGSVEVVDQDGRSVDATAEPDGVLSFETDPGRRYHVRPVGA